MAEKLLKLKKTIDHDHSNNCITTKEFNVFTSQIKQKM